MAAFPGAAFPDGRSIPFIVPTIDGGSFEVSKEAVAFLCGLSCPVAPVCVVGKYRLDDSVLSYESILKLINTSRANLV